MVPQSWFEQRFRQVSLYFFDPSATRAGPRAGLRAARAAVRLDAGQRAARRARRPSSTRAELPARRSCRSGGLGAGLAERRGRGRPDQRQPGMPVPPSATRPSCWSPSSPGRCARTRRSSGSRSPSTAGRCSCRRRDGVQRRARARVRAVRRRARARLLFGLQDGLMVGGSPQNLETGHRAVRPGRLRPAHRSPPDLRAEQVAGVSTSGSTLWVGPVKDSGTAATTADHRRVRTCCGPAWDFSGRLWEVDRRKAGAVVSTCARAPDAHPRRGGHQRRGRQGLPRLPRRLAAGRGDPRGRRATTRSW